MSTNILPRHRLSAYGVAARALASRWNTLRPGSVLIPETPESARAEYVAARERGESVPAALSRARAELVAYRVLSSARLWDEDLPGDVLDAYDVDLRELARVTSDRRYATLAGERRDAETGALILSPVILPDGATARVHVYADDDSTPDGEAYDDPETQGAYDAGDWRFVGVSVVVTLADGARGEASLWGVEMGDYFPGSRAAQIWHAIPDLVREAAAGVGGPDPENIPEADRATCGTCGRSRNARTLPTPADRCPWEHEHDDDDDASPFQSLADEVRDEVNRELVRFVENAEDGATATDAAADVVQRLAFLYGVYAEVAR